MASRGAWVDILCTLWNAKKRGQKTLSLEGWAGELGKPVAEVSLYLLDLESHEIGKFIHEKDEKITIISRRMVRDERARRLAANRKQKQRDKSESRTLSRNGHGDVTGIYQKSEVIYQKSYSEEEKKEDMSRHRDDVSPSRNFREEAKEVLAFLNAKTGKQYRPVETTLTMIMARLKGQGPETAVDVQTCKSLIAKKVRDWGGDEKMSKYLRPETLFNRTKFESYLGELNLCVVQNVTGSCQPTPLAAPAGGGHLRSL